MGYSRETERQNKALKSILRGETPEKKIFVGGVDKEFSEKIKEKEREAERRKSFNILLYISSYKNIVVYFV